MSEHEGPNEAVLTEAEAQKVQLQQRLLLAEHYYPLVQRQRPAVFYPTAPGALNVGKFPNPAAVVRFLGNNLEAQKFLSRKAQVIIRMRGLPYDASSKQVVSLKNLIVFFTTMTAIKPI